MWKRNDNGAAPPSNGASEIGDTDPLATDFRSTAVTGRSGSSPAILGNTVAIKGEISGNEDLVINGQIEGSVTLGGYVVTVGPEGRVTADVFASEVEVEGAIEGDIVAEEKITIRAEGKVIGNIKAPRVVLEEGCQFKGSVAMDTTARDSYSSGIVDIETETDSVTSFLVDRSS